jgi:hypothetical protein
VNLEGRSRDEWENRLRYCRRDTVLRATILATLLVMAVLPTTASAVDPSNPNQPVIVPAVQDPVPHLSPRLPAVQNTHLPAVQSVRVPAVQSVRLPAVQMRIR